MHLRIVGNQDPAIVGDWARRRDGREAVSRENVAAVAARRPDLDSTDPRWVLAVRVHSLLQGATLSPEHREHVMQTARLLGVRAFDATLVIALVQDAARRGEALGSTSGALALIRRPEPRRSWRREAIRLGAAIASAVVLGILLIRWFI